jgi:hypothetical protein
MPRHHLATAAALLAIASPALAQALPAGIKRQVPNNYQVLAAAVSSVTPAHKFYLVALAARTKSGRSNAGTASSVRPLLIFERRAGERYVLVARNDRVIFKANEGGAAGCDPFAEHTLAVQGNYFTVEQGVACGSHWTDYVTFRYSLAANGYIFDNWRTESWSLNVPNNSNAPALVSNGQTIVRAKGKTVAFAKWRRPSN